MKSVIKTEPLELTAALVLGDMKYHENNMIIISAVDQTDRNKTEINICSYKRSQH